jgi:hypothetical protein
VEKRMNKDVNRPKAGLIMYHESGDEHHWLIVTPELFQEVTDLINSVPSNQWDNQVEHQVFTQVCDLLGEHHTNPRILVDGFTQTWILEDAHFLNKYEFIGFRTIPMY